MRNWNENYTCPKRSVIIAHFRGKTSYLVSCLVTAWTRYTDSARAMFTCPPGFRQRFTLPTGNYAFPMAKLLPRSRLFSTRSPPSLREKRARLIPKVTSLRRTVLARVTHRAYREFNDVSSPMDSRFSDTRLEPVKQPGSRRGKKLSGGFDAISSTTNARRARFFSGIKCAHVPFRFVPFRSIPFRRIY